MSDERIFTQVKASLYNFSPEVPEAAYKGMRRKLWMSNFTRLSATRFNMWYLLLALAGGTAVFAYNFNESASAESPRMNENPTFIAVPATINEIASENAGSTSCSTATTSACCSSAKAGPSATSCSNHHESADNSISAQATDRVKEEAIVSTPVLIAEEDQVIEASNEGVMPEVEVVNPTIQQRKGKSWPVYVPKDREPKKD